MYHWILESPPSGPGLEEVRSAPAAEPVPLSAVFAHPKEL